MSTFALKGLQSGCNSRKERFESHRLALKTTERTHNPVENQANKLGEQSAREAAAMASPAKTELYSNERRQGNRVGLRWPVTLIRADESLVETVTENLSSKGFYFVAMNILIPGEEVRVRISIPIKANSHAFGHGTILGRARVTRIQAVGPNRYGVGCSLEDYYVMP
jgi:hypothetical protein